MPAGNVETFTRARRDQLRIALGDAGRAAPPPPQPEPSEADDAWRKVAIAIGRAQRSVHPRATAEGLLREELTELGRGHSGVAALMKEAFTDGGALRDSLGELMGRAQILARNEGASGPLFLADRDARVLPVVRSALGVRHRTFKEAVEAMSETAYPDWPLSGPRTVLWVLAFIAEHYSTPEHRHSRFITDGKLAYSDAGVTAHQVIMKLLYLAAVVDQVNLGEMSWAELAGRHAQMVELKYKSKFIPAPPKNPQMTDPFDDTHLYLGVSATRGMLAVCPELERWVGKQLSDEYMVIKERRKALEALRGPKGSGT